MPGGDFVSVQFNEQGAAEVKDRWNDQFGLPKEDCSQDWTLVKFERQSSGRAVAELRRLLDTNDTQDRPIYPGDTRILFAWGSSMTPSYHDTNRGFDAITFIPTATQLPNLPSDGITATFLMPNVTIPAVETTYNCKSFALPTDRPYHAVSVQAVINPSSAAYVHHFIAYLCKYADTTGNYPKAYQNTAGTCSSPIGVSTSGCSMVLYVWASGVQELRLPAAAGYPINPNTNYLVLEVHYNNPSATTGIVDSSGVQIVYTPTLRTYEAATLVLGDPLVQFPALAANTANQHLEAGCPSTCTNGWPHDITVIGSFLHMHMHGKRMWTSQWRGGNRVQTLNRVDFYSYHLQQLTPLNTTIRRGDVLNTHCVMDTTNTGTVAFGTSTQEEMCMNFVSYYPRLYFPSNVNRTGNMCGFAGSSSTICGDAAGGYIPGANPGTPDPVADRTVTYGSPKIGCVPTVAAPTATGSNGSPNAPSSKSGVNSPATSTLTGAFSFFAFALMVLATLC